LTFVGKIGSRGIGLHFCKTDVGTAKLLVGSASLGTLARRVKSVAYLPNDATAAPVSMYLPPIE